MTTVKQWITLGTVTATLLVKFAERAPFFVKSERERINSQD